MEKAIIQKEWIKTSKVFLLCFAVSVAMVVYAALRVNRLVELKGAEHLWLIMLLKDNSFVDIMKWTPVFASLAIALAQMLPEMSQKRLKLTLHLPYPQFRMTLIMLAFGMAELIAIFAVQTAIIGIYYSTLLPHQLVWRVLLSMLPWFFAGFVAYIVTCAVCIEGKRVRRILLAILGLCLVTILYEQPALEAYNGMAWMMIVLVLLLFVLPLGSVIRFKQGLQD